jgi:uncharacterized protein (TIGR01732 family)
MGIHTYLQFLLPLFYTFHTLQYGKVEEVYGMSGGGHGSGFALIVVLFILLVIVGAAFVGGGYGGGY